MLCCSGLFANPHIVQRATVCVCVCVHVSLSLCFSLPFPQFSNDIQGGMFLPFLDHLVTNSLLQFSIYTIGSSTPKLSFTLYILKSLLLHAKYHSTFTHYGKIFIKKFQEMLIFFSKLAAKKCLESLAHILYLKFVEVDAEW